MSIFPRQEPLSQNRRKSAGVTEILMKKEGNLTELFRNSSVIPDEKDHRQTGPFGSNTRLKEKQKGGNGKKKGRV